VSYEQAHSSPIFEPVVRNVPDKALLDELGITAKPHITYEWNGFRYTNAADAIAAARRAKP
jgi:hypothetical protein